MVVLGGGGGGYERGTSVYGGRAGMSTALRVWVSRREGHLGCTVLNLGHRF